MTSRQIKFRAWNFKDKKMYSAEEMTRDQMALLPDGHFANISSESTRLNIIYRHDQMIPLQYTGNKDKNGKEIYEGDIVVYGEQFKWVIEFDFLALAQMPKNVEIVGNIYETPELIK